MNAFENPQWLDRVVVVRKDKAGDLLSALKDAGIEAAAEDFGLCAEGIEIETIKIPEGQSEAARKIVRAFKAGK